MNLNFQGSRHCTRCSEAKTTWRPSRRLFRGSPEHVEVVADVFRRPQAASGSVAETEIVLAQSRAGPRQPALSADPAALDAEVKWAG